MQIVSFFGDFSIYAIISPFLNILYVILVTL